MYISFLCCIFCPQLPLWPRVGLVEEGEIAMNWLLPGRWVCVCAHYIISCCSATSVILITVVIVSRLLLNKKQRLFCSLLLHVWEVLFSLYVVVFPEFLSQSFFSFRCSLSCINVMLMREIFKKSDQSSRDNSCPVLRNGSKSLDTTMELSDVFNSSHHISSFNSSFKTKTK